jgi:hypothetical protein
MYEYYMFRLIAIIIMYIELSQTPFFPRREQSSGMWRRVGIGLTDVSEERIASIFKVEEKIRKSASEEPVRAGANRLIDQFFAVSPGEGRDSTFVQSETAPLANSFQSIIRIHFHSVHSH